MLAPALRQLGYLLRTDAGDWRSLVSLIGEDRLKENLGLVGNRIADREIPGELRAGRCSSRCSACSASRAA